LSRPTLTNFYCDEPQTSGLCAAINLFSFSSHTFWNQNLGAVGLLRGSLVES
jgi:hypothetical protein